VDRTAPAYERLSRVYDIDWRHAAEAYVPLLARLLGRVEKKRVLDLGCGTGLLALELANWGHRVVGIDRSPAMIDVARRKANGRSDVTFSMGDIRRFDVGTGFDAVICTFDALNYVTETTELRSMFRCVRDAIEDHGRFVFDFTTPTMYEVHHKGALHRTIGSQPICQWLRYDRRSRLAVTRFRFGDDVVEVHRQRAYEMVDVARALRTGGMVVDEAYSGWEMRGYDSLAQRVICLASPADR